MTDFTRRKFTITNELDDVLTTLANQHYQGNVSLCLRAAIENHRETVEGNSGESLAMKRLGAQLKDLNSRQEELLEAIQELSDTASEQRHSDPDQTPGYTSEIPESTGRVYAVLADAEESLRFSDITDLVDAPALEVQSALGTLIDYGSVTSEDTNPRRFLLAGQSTGLP